MARGAWYAYVGLIWLFLAAMAVQIYLAGLGLFAGADRMQLHRDVGWWLHLPVLLILVAALLARVRRPTIWWVLAFFVIGAVQPILATFKGGAPLVAALHPLSGVVLSLITVKLALDTLPLLRTAGEG